MSSALAQLLAAGMSNSVLGFSSTPLVPAQPPIITFDAPGAGTGPMQGTLAFAINPVGTIAGYYFDPSPVTHSFLRAPDGTFTEFDAPGGGTGPYQGTFSFSINSAGAVTGFTSDSNYVSHGFLRAPDGTFDTFDATGAGTGLGQGTQGLNINPSDVIAGYYIDSSGLFHGFVRTSDGTITSFDAPGAGTGPNQGTEIGSVDNLNPAGAISGDSIDATMCFTATYALPTAPSPSSTLRVRAQDPTKVLYAVASTRQEPLWVLHRFERCHGFVRAPDGTFTTFDVSGAGTGPGQGTLPENINDLGDTTVQYVDASGVNHGFLSTSDGTITTFDAPGAGTGPNERTTASCNNQLDAITG